MAVLLKLPMSLPPLSTSPPKSPLCSKLDPTARLPCHPTMAVAGDGVISVADTMPTVLGKAEQAGEAAFTPVTRSSLGQKLSSGCPFLSMVGTTCSHSHHPSPAAFQGLNPSAASPGDFRLPERQLHSHLWLIPDCSLNYSICCTALSFNSFYFCPENNEVWGFLPSSCPLRGHIRIKKSTTSA